MPSRRLVQPLTNPYRKSGIISGAPPVPACDSVGLRPARPALHVQPQLPSARRHAAPKAKLQRHFVPGYDRTVPPGHFATRFS